VRAIGTAHSFNRIADSTAQQVSVSALPQRIDVDEQTMTAYVSAGLRYGEVAVALHERGFALKNLGSLPHISVAGACATGTHGSGLKNGSLPSSVNAVELVTADGSLTTLRRGVDQSFPAAAVSLGCLGVATTVGLDIVPSFDVRQVVYDDLPTAALLDNFESVLGAAYSVSLFTTWSRDVVDQVWCKHKAEAASKSDPAASHQAAPDASWLGATLASTARHPIASMPARNCTQQLGIAGPWHERLPHFRLEFTPSSGEELQTEYLLPLRHGTDAFNALCEIADRIAPILQISEIRTIAADDLWLSPAYGDDSIAFHFTWLPDTQAVLPVVAAIESQLAPFGARPHWGKLFTTAPDVVTAAYPRFGDFARAMQSMDSTGKFRNEFIEQFFRTA
jgi:alditol oxidase